MNSPDNFPAFSGTVFRGDINFESEALQLFLFQAEHVAVYRDFIRLLKVKPEKINCINDIPFLPVEFFKTHRVLTNGLEPEVIFKSSGTTGMQPSQHYVYKAAVYRDAFIHSFENFYGSADDYAFVCLLPSYLERNNSSLVYMADYLIRHSKNKYSDFFLDDFERLYQTLLSLNEQNEKTILLGVTYALLDFVNFLSLKGKPAFDHLIVMETGGMKGKRKEMVRDEVHALLTDGFGLESIHSEYGMTELLSQSYSKGNGLFYSPPWQKILIRDVNDAVTILPAGASGGINVIDLANYYSCAFIATGDLGRINCDGSFSVLGRFDQSDLRGCNLLVV